MRIAAGEEYATIVLSQNTVVNGHSHGTVRESRRILFL